MPDDLAALWLVRIKQTMAVDLSRGMAHGLPPKALVEMLFQIPEVEQAFELRANARRDQSGKFVLVEPS